MTRHRLVAVSCPADDAVIAAITGTLAGAAETCFLAGVGQSEQRAVLRQANALISLRPAEELPGTALAQAPRLRFLQLLPAGVDHVDFATIPPEVMVAANVGAYADPIAEHVMAMTLSLAKHLQVMHAALKRGEFDHQLRSATLRGAVIGILGFGGIGQATARLMRPFGARIHALNTSGRTNEPVDWIGTLRELDDLLAVADVLVIAIPLTAATRDLIGDRELGLMKTDAILVNVARGAVVEERALYEHLRHNPRFSAAIDTWWDEPPDGTGFRTHHPFFELPNLLGSPHNSENVPGVMQHAARLAAENTRRFLEGDPVLGVATRADYITTH